MKKLIAALVLATSFAALADDAAKTPAPAKSEKTEKKSEKKSDTKTETKTPPPASEKAPATK